MLRLRFWVPWFVAFVNRMPYYFFQSSRFWAVAAFDGTWSDYMRFRSKLRYRSFAALLTRCNNLVEAALRLLIFRFAVRGGYATASPAKKVQERGMIDPSAKPGCFLFFFAFLVGIFQLQVRIKTRKANITTFQCIVKQCPDSSGYTVWFIPLAIEFELGRHSCLHPWRALYFFILPGLSGSCSSAVFDWHGGVGVSFFKPIYANV